MIIYMLNSESELKNLSYDFFKNQYPNEEIILFKDFLNGDFFNNLNKENNSSSNSEQIRLTFVGHFNRGGKKFGKHNAEDFSKSICDTLKKIAESHPEIKEKKIIIDIITCGAGLVYENGDCYALEAAENIYQLTFEGFNKFKLNTQTNLVLENPDLVYAIQTSREGEYLYTIGVKNHHYWDKLHILGKTLQQAKNKFYELKNELVKLENDKNKKLLKITLNKTNEEIIKMENKISKISFNLFPKAKDYRIHIDNDSRFNFIRHYKKGHLLSLKKIRLEINEIKIPLLSKTNTTENKKLKQIKKQLDYYATSLRENILNKENGIDIEKLGMLVKQVQNNFEFINKKIEKYNALINMNELNKDMHHIRKIYKTKKMNKIDITSKEFKKIKNEYDQYTSINQNLLETYNEIISKLRSLKNEKSESQLIINNGKEELERIKNFYKELSNDKGKNKKQLSLLEKNVNLINSVLEKRMAYIEEIDSKVDTYKKLYFPLKDSLTFLGDKIKKCEKFFELREEEKMLIKEITTKKVKNDKEFTNTNSLKKISPN